MRIAVFGDIHGNIFALHAVLADLRLQRPDALVVTGDLAYKFPWGAEVIDLLRSFPCHCILGNGELYLLLWNTTLWPDHWQLPLACDLIAWDRARIGSERLAWLAGLPEHVAFSAGRLEDLLIVHGVPGNPFLPLLARPGEDRSPWVQTDQRVQELLGSVDSDVVVSGHTHSLLQRHVIRAAGRTTLIVNPGSLSYNRGPTKGAGRADYALLDWSGRGGWQVIPRIVYYDAAPLHAALLSLRGDFPLAAFMANRVRPEGASWVAEEAPDFRVHRWGDTPQWWQERDRVQAWRTLRGEDR